MASKQRVPPLEPRLVPGQFPGTWLSSRPLSKVSTDMSTLYEVALVGEFFQPDLQVILNRFTLHSESAQKMHSQEVIFEPIDAAAQRAATTVPIQLRCRKELLESDSGWYAPNASK
jgi:hypothetical protein